MAPQSWTVQDYPEHGAEVRLVPWGMGKPHECTRDCAGREHMVLIFARADATPRMIAELSRDKAIGLDLPGGFRLGVFTGRIAQARDAPGFQAWLRARHMPPSPERDEAMVAWKTWWRV